MYKSYLTVCGGVLFRIVFMLLILASGIGLLSMPFIFPAPIFMGLPFFISMLSIGMLPISISISFFLAVSFGICTLGGVIFAGFSLTSFIPHFGQLPGLAAWISGCMGQVYLTGWDC